MTTIYKPLFTPPYPRAVVFKWLLMAFMAGNINAGGFMACKRFVTHVTGFGTWFGIEAADGNWRTAIGMLSVPFYFLLGVMVGAWFTDAAITKGRTPRFGVAMGLEALVLAGVAIGGYFDVFGFFGSTFNMEQDYALLVLLCTASGLQNAVITTSSGGFMRSTHLTGTTTDLGIGLVRGLFGHSQAKLAQKEAYRNWLRLGTIGAFCVGSVVGAVLFISGEYLGFLLPAVLAVYVGNLGFRSASAPGTQAAALLAVALLGAALPGSAAAKDHPGPYGLKWGKSPADARSVLAGKVTFVSEKPAEDAPYETIDQHYTGTFGKLPTADIFLRFYKAEFFYMAVTLATADAKTASKVWEQAVAKMQAVYGRPLKFVQAPSLGSAKAIPDNLPMKENKAWVMPLLWNEQTRKSEDDLFLLHDLQIRTGLWDPFAGWKFDNKVTVQTFVNQELHADGKSTTLKPVWIFAKDDTFKKWKDEVRNSKLIEPRDF